MDVQEETRFTRRVKCLLASYFHLRRLVKCLFTLHFQSPPCFFVPESYNDFGVGNMELFDSLERILPNITALAAVAVAGVQVFASRRTPIDSACFSDTANAYAAYLEAITGFVFYGDDPHRDALTAALYRVALFGDDRLAKQAETIYAHVIDWTRSGRPAPFPFDNEVHALESDMREDLRKLRRRGFRK